MPNTANAHTVQDVMKWLLHNFHLHIGYGILCVNNCENTGNLCSCSTTCQVTDIRQGEVGELESRLPVCGCSK